MEVLNSLIFSTLVVFCFVSSGFAQTSVCPSAESIVPCGCSSVDGFPSLNCILITDEEALERVFSANFPVPDIETFKLSQSDITEITRNVFGNVTFRHIEIDSIYLEHVSDDAFDNSLDTLRFLRVMNTPITVNSFPFHKLDQFSVLLEVLFQNNILTSFPKISSYSLVALRILNNAIQYLGKEDLAGLPNIDALNLNGNFISDIDGESFFFNEFLRAVYFENNSLTAIDGDLFLNLTDTVYLSFENNYISELSYGLFEHLAELQEMNLANNKIKNLTFEYFGMGSNLLTLLLQNNDISDIQSGTFYGTPSLRTLDLSNNNLTRIVTQTFEGLNDLTLRLQNNYIDYIESDAFLNVTKSLVHLENNKLTVLYEFWLRDLLENGNQVFVNGNPFTCGCEIAWIFEDPDFQVEVIGQCPDGKYISELDPTYYQTQC